VANSTFIIVEEQELETSEYLITNRTKNITVHLKQSYLSSEYFDEYEHGCENIIYALDDHNEDQILECEFEFEEEKCIGFIDLNKVG